MGTPYSLRGKRIAVAGDRGMVGSAIVRRLSREACEILPLGRAQADLRNQRAVEDWFAAERPEAVFVTAAKVGGILANDSAPADFLYDNLMIAANVIHSAHRSGVEKLLFLGSSCIYPKFAEQPIREESLLTGALEPTNQWYAVAKIAGIKLCQAYRRQHGCDFIAALPTNLYGPGDNYDPLASHVLPALLRKAHLLKTGQAQVMTIWGTGSPRRELMHVDDCADACVLLMERYSSEEPVNIGTGKDIPIVDLARLVCRVIGVDFRAEHDLSKPDGTPAKLMDTTRLRQLGWAPAVDLEHGIRETYAAMIANGAIRWDVPAHALSCRYPATLTSRQ